MAQPLGREDHRIVVKLLEILHRLLAWSRRQGVGFVCGHHPVPHLMGKTAFLLSSSDPSLSRACPPSDFPLLARRRSEIGGPLYQEPVMAIAVLANPLDLTSRIQTFVGRHADKSFDWDAFPGSRGFPE